MYFLVFIIMSIAAVYYFNLMKSILKTKIIQYVF